MANLASKYVASRLVAAVAAGALLSVGTGRAEDTAKQAGSTLQLTVSEAVLTALGHNVALDVERLQPAIRKQYEEVERAVFDPRVAAGMTVDDVTGLNEERGVLVEAGVERQFATGTAVGVTGFVDDRTDSGLDQRELGLDVEVTQALLRGRGREVNLAALRQAAIDTEISQFELRGVAEGLVAQVENAYWECVLAREKIAIYTKSLEVAEQQIAEVREQINVGKLAELDLAASEAEVAEKREQLISARRDLAVQLLEFRRLVNPQGGQWTRELSFADQPQQPDIKLDEVGSHVELALRQRPDLCQARLGVSKGELEIVRTRNGLLPRLDLFVSLGGSRYAESFAKADERDDLRASAGLALDLPFGLRAEKAKHRVAELSLKQTGMVLTNMEQLVQYDVRAAYVQVGVAREQIAATAATRKLRQDTLTAEQEKFRVGTSTTLQVAQAWRDLIASQINEIQAVVSLRKALVDLYRLEGTLLERRGIKLEE